VVGTAYTAGERGGGGAGGGGRWDALLWFAHALVDQCQEKTRNENRWQTSSGPTAPAKTKRRLGDNGKRLLAEAIEKRVLEGKAAGILEGPATRQNLVSAAPKKSSAVCLGHRRRRSRHEQDLQKSTM